MATSVMINHPNHHHDLKLKSAERSPFSCDGCKERVFGASYECKPCKFHLHVECATMLPYPPAVRHPFCKGCEFVPRKESGQYYDKSLSPCHACGRVVLGFSYRCMHKKAHHLHPFCFSLPQIVTGEDGIRLRLTKKVSSKCGRCKSKKISNGIKGWGYVAECDDSNCYHVGCVMDMIVEKFQTSSSNYPVVPISTSTALERRGNGSFFKRFLKRVPKKQIFKLIASTIIGDPTGIIAAALF